MKWHSLNNFLQFKKTHSQTQHTYTPISTKIQFLFRNLFPFIVVVCNLPFCFAKVCTYSMHQICTVLIYNVTFILFESIFVRCNQECCFPSNGIGRVCSLPHWIQILIHTLCTYAHLLVWTCVGQKKFMFVNRTRFTSQMCHIKYHFHNPTFISTPMQNLKPLKLAKSNIWLVVNVTQR